MSEGSPLRRLADQPQFIMWACFGALIAAAWSYLAAVSPFAYAAADIPQILRNLCIGDTDPWSVKSLVAAAIMWAAMVLAMMLPSAAPMVATYMDISQAARDKGEPIAPAGVLIGGYLTVWLLFSVAMVIVQSKLQHEAMLDTYEALSSPWLSAAILTGAGVYQFTPIKHACLHQCAHPMPWFLANWRPGWTGTYAMGVQQGVFCLGCCWAMMMLMFVAGLMNLFWMAALGLVMIAEKTVANARWVSYASGLALITAGIATLLLARTGV